MNLMGTEDPFLKNPNAGHNLTTGRVGNLSSSSAGGGSIKRGRKSARSVPMMVERQPQESGNPYMNSRYRARADLSHQIPLR